MAFYILQIMIQTKVMLNENFARNFQNKIQYYLVYSSNLKYKDQTENMSNKKPNLTIEIQELGDEYNSKFQGYVQYPAQHYNQFQPKQSNNDVYASRASNRSNQSNTSQRSAILERAQQILLEQRLEKNMQSLSRKRLKAYSNSKNSKRVSTFVQDQELDARKLPKNSKIDTNPKPITRSKSANALNAEQSRAKILLNIAENLNKVQKMKKSDFVVETKSNATSRVHSQQNSQTHSRVERIKQIKQQMIKNRGGKLQHLLKDIKRSNKQAYKVVYTIKKSAKKHNSPFQKSLQMRDQIHEEGKKSGIVGNNLFSNSQKSEQLKKLADELQNVRLELKEVKNKNEEILSSHYRSANTSYIAYNLDSASQSSRITRQIQALQFDDVSNGGSHRQPQSPHNGSGSIAQPSFTKGEPKNNSFYNANNQNYQVIEQPIFVQPCFACGCTCRARLNNKVK